MKYITTIEIYTSYGNGEGKQYVIPTGTIIDVEYIDDKKECLWFRQEGDDNVVPDYMSINTFIASCKKL